MFAVVDVYPSEPAPQGQRREVSRVQVVPGRDGLGEHLRADLRLRVGRVRDGDVMNLGGVGEREGRRGQIPE